MTGEQTTEYSNTLQHYCLEIIYNDRRKFPKHKLMEEKCQLFFEKNNICTISRVENVRDFQFHKIYSTLILIILPPTSG